MKPTGQQLTEARKAYEIMWRSYFDNDPTAYASVVDEEFRMIGTSENEGFRNKAEALDYLRSQTEEIGGKVVLKNRSVEETPVDDLVLITETADVYVLIESEWRFYSNMRVSSFLHETAEGWKLIQLHSSLPDARVQEETES